MTAFAQATAEGEAPIVVMLGPPGAGKSTQVELVRRRTGRGTVVASVPLLIRRDPLLLSFLTEEERCELERLDAAAWAAAGRGELSPLRFDEILFRALPRIDADLLLLDACPRAVAPVCEYLAVPGLAARSLVVELTLRDGVERSVARQLARESALLGAAAAAKLERVYRRKAELYVDETLAGLELLRSAGIQSIAVDADRPAAAVHARIISAIPAPARVKVIA